MAAIVRFGDMGLSLVAVVAVVLMTIPYMALALVRCLSLSLSPSPPPSLPCLCRTNGADCPCVPLSPLSHMPVPTTRHPTPQNNPKRHPPTTQAIILPLAFSIASTFIALSTPLKRLESASRSPLYQHFTESVAGLVVLRAYQTESLFLTRLHHDVDEADRMHFVMWIANYYMSMRLRLLGATVAGVTALAVVLKVRRGPLLVD